MRSTTVEPYGAKLHIATSQADLTRLNRRFAGQLEEMDGLGGTTGVLDTETNQYHVIVAIDLARLVTDLDIVLTCVHEAVHAAGLVLSHVGQPYDWASEAYAYLVEWVTEKAMGATHAPRSEARPRS